MANNIDLNAKLHNRFDIEVIDAKTGEVKQRAQAFNVICNQLWTRLLSSNGMKYFAYIHYGTGSGTPSASDTSLFTYLGNAAAATDGSSCDYDNGYAYVRRSIQLAAETAVGATITEVGIGYGSAANTLCTHAMLQDMNGNPISITKTATDVINIYATVYVHWNPSAFAASGVHPNLSWNRGLLTWLTGSESSTAQYPNRIYLLNSFNEQVRSSGWAPENESAYLTPTIAYSTANKTITITMGRAGVNYANFSGLRRVVLSYYQNPATNTSRPFLDLHVGGAWYPHSTITNEAVGTGDGATKDFSLDFPFAHNATFYIDGVAQSGVTVDYAPNTTDFSYALIPYNYPDASDISVLPAGFRDYNPGNNISKCILYNPAYAVGLGSLRVFASGNIEASNDLSTWETIGTMSSSGTFTIPAEHQHHKYYRGWVGGSSDGIIATAPASFTGNVVHFSTPPANGAVITADYQCDCIAKDADHVFDLTVTLQLGEYTEV